MLTNKRGIVTITYSQMSEIELNEDIAQLKLKSLFGNFFPFYIDNNWGESRIKYSGYSPDFRELAENEVMPHYTLEFVLSENNSSCTCKLTEKF